ncbi:MAG: RNB domain-containing ribonuclease, partial [Deltaproteobacteria bacterium]|nr:RNB domain-containing ribonuclease [Deltaproteobacteria bacterium]
EPEIILDIEGRPQDIIKSERNIAHRIIEEFMLAANKAVAEVFTEKNYPFLYRVHERPDEESINEFREFVRGFGYHLEERATPKVFQKILESVKGRSEEKLINHVLLRSMRQAVYSEKNIGHFGLAFADYAHFTSPIRRYPDLVVHRLLKGFIKKRLPKKELERMEKALPEIASHSSARERKAMEAERESVDLKKVQFMQDKAGETFGGFISGVTSFGFFVELKDYFVEGLVHVTTLKDDYYIFKEKEHALVGENTKKRFRLAGEVTVVIDRVDIERRRIDMVLAKEDSGKAKRK